MNALRQALADYLAVRHALGYKLITTERLLAQFVTYLEEHCEDRVTIATAVAWATLPSGTSRGWTSTRLSIVRRFAVHLRGINPATQVPPRNLLPGRHRRATPYLYSEGEIEALIAAAATLRTSHRQATYRTLVGLLAVTGIRVGEAIQLDQADLNVANSLLTVRHGKFGKSRELPLHPSTVLALSGYLGRADRPRVRSRTPALFVSPAGTRLLYNNVQHTFHQLVCRVGITPRSAACRPRIHDIRHNFAVNTILDSYRDGGDPGSQLAVLSTYLGHVDPAGTYWYLSAAPELMRVAADRLERHLGDGT